MTIAAGTRLGSYEVVAQIGAGGMGVVYEAEGLKLHRHVALKFHPERLAAVPSVSPPTRVFAAR
jgi:eukaryotic-like serine/threonine-protein kinase